MAERGIGLSIEVDSGALAELQAAAQDLRPTIRRAAKLALPVVAQSIRAKAAWSSRIPGAVGVERTRSGGHIVIDPDVAPEAAPLNNRDRAGEFEHPVYGQEDVIVSQPARPFFAAGAAAAQASVDRIMQDALKQWERSAGFK